LHWLAPVAPAPGARLGNRGTLKLLEKLKSLQAIFRFGFGNGRGMSPAQAYIKGREEEITTTP
jgi:hypothetical protein